jgi:G3E family GTPase
MEDSCEPNLIPVTLLSGFLGAGKTTLLCHILRNKENLRCAIIVNDMASLNIDAALVSEAEILQRDEKMISMQNGCICCTLREDLLVEIAEIAKSKKFDYIIIESTGISEPMQVAETFALHSKDDDSSSIPTLEKIARLDTCVTVVDAANIFPYFENSKFIDEEFGNEGKQETLLRVVPKDKGDTSTDLEEIVEVPVERTVIDLLIDQIEFSNVVILNKMDCTSKIQLEKAIALIRRLNPSAEIIPTIFSQVPLKHVLNTRKFDYEKAANSPGWLQSLEEKHTPETEEYGISSFIYRRRRPFHPMRLFQLVVKYFMILEYGNEQHEHDDEGEEEEENKSQVDEESAMETEDEEDVGDEKDEEERRLQEAEIQERLLSKKASVFAELFRSKGFFWLATRPDLIGEWAQAGTILSIKPMHEWLALSIDAQTSETEGNTSAAISSNEEEDRETIIARYFAKKEDCNDDEKEAWLVGDRRQEIVFIGSFATSTATSEMTKNEIVRLLDECLVTDEEWIGVKEAMMEIQSLRTQEAEDQKKISDEPNENSEEVGNDGDEEAMDEVEDEIELPKFLQDMEDPWESWTSSLGNDHDHDHAHETEV